MPPTDASLFLLSIITHGNDVDKKSSRLSRFEISNKDLKALKAQRILFKTALVKLEQRLKNYHVDGMPPKDIPDLENSFAKLHIFAGKIQSSFSQCKFSPAGIISPARQEVIQYITGLTEELMWIARSLPPSHDESFGIESLDDLSTQSRNDSVQGLWKACCNAVTSLSTYARPEDPVMQQCRNLLKLWGSGLFNGGELDPDLLLGALPSAQEKLARPLASRFVEVALVAYRLIEVLISNESGRSTSRLQDASIRLKTTLLSTDTTQPMLDELLYASVGGNIGGLASTEEPLDSRINHLSSMVELLFGYLSAINRLRRTNVLAGEAAEQRKLTIEVPDQSSENDELDTKSATISRPAARYGSEEAQNEVDMLVSENLAALKDLEEKLWDDPGQTLGSEALRFYLKSEIKYLEYYWKRLRLIHPVEIPEETAVIKEQKELQNKLQAILQMPINSLGDLSLREGKQALVTEHRARDIVQCLKDITAHLNELASLKFMRNR